MCQVVAGVLKILRADLHENFTTSMAQLGIDPDLDDSSFLFNCSVFKKYGLRAGFSIRGACSPTWAADTTLLESLKEAAAAAAPAADHDEKN